MTQRGNYYMSSPRNDTAKHLHNLYISARFTASFKPDALTTGQKATSPHTILGD